MPMRKNPTRSVSRGFSVPCWSAEFSCHRHNSKRSSSRPYTPKRTYSEPSKLQRNLWRKSLTTQLSLRIARACIPLFRRGIRKLEYFRFLFQYSSQSKDTVIRILFVRNCKLPLSWSAFNCLKIQRLIIFIKVSYDIGLQGAMYLAVNATTFHDEIARRNIRALCSENSVVDA